MGSGSGHPRGDASPLTLKGQAHICGSSANGHGRARVSGCPRGRSGVIHGPEGLEWQNGPRTGGGWWQAPPRLLCTPPAPVRSPRRTAGWRPDFEKRPQIRVLSPTPTPGPLSPPLASSFLRSPRCRKSDRKSGRLRTSGGLTPEHAGARGRSRAPLPPARPPQLPPSALLVGVSAQGPAPRPPPAHLRSRARSPPPRGAGPRPGEGVCSRPFAACDGA